MPSHADPLELKVEAILFASGHPLSVSELGEKLGEPDFRVVQRAVRHLARTYENRQTSLEVRRVGDRYALQVREEFLPTAQTVQPMEMEPRTLKALTLIAYHQPMLQSFLVKMAGETAYHDVAELVSLGLVRAEPKGSTLELGTTARFAEYFGIGSSRPEEIRQFLAGKLGLSAGGAEAPEASRAPEAERASAPTSDAARASPVVPDGARDTRPATAEPAPERPAAEPA